MTCTHEGAIWKIDVLDRPPTTGPCDWECTRCGERWDHDPRPARGHGGARVRHGSTLAPR
ncbi:MAG: hypothetical protein ACXVWU_07250 [Nocardioides sp.]